MVLEFDETNMEKKSDGNDLDRQGNGSRLKLCYYTCCTFFFFTKVIGVGGFKWGILPVTENIISKGFKFLLSDIAM